MNIIKRTLVVFISLFITNALFAQEATTTQAKVAELKQPADANLKVPATPPMQPGNAVVPKTEVEKQAAPVAEPKRDDTKNGPDKSKTQVLQLETSKAEMFRKEPIESAPLITPNTNTIKPVPLTKPAVKEQ
ncbi:MAG TPA: hypothetical protein VHL77_07795 [Ferruginibacter sp.]|nr:hypothetical protein [Ferruginibacter sp.]